MCTNATDIINAISQWLTFIIKLDQLTLIEWHDTFRNWRHLRRLLFMEQYNLSWILWMQKMVLGKSRRHLRAATMNNHRCLRSSVCMCTHVHAWFQIKCVTRNKSYAKGKAWSWPRHDSFILNPKLGWSLADGHKHMQSPVHWSKYKCCDGRPTGSKHKA